MDIKLIAFIVILIMMPLPVTAIEKSDEYINYTTDLIFNDCKEKNISIKPSMIKNNQTGMHIELLPYPYTKRNIKQILNIFSPVDFNEHRAVAPLSDNRLDGLNLLKCGNMSLDILGRLWYWKDKEIVSFSAIEKTSINQNIFNSTVLGDVLQTANTGAEVNQFGKAENSIIQQKIKSENWFLNIIMDINFYIGISVTITISLLLKWLFKFKIVKKKK